MFSCDATARRYADKINEYSALYGVPSVVSFAVCDTESHYNSKAKSPSGAIGIMQIMPQTGEWIAKTLGYPDYKISDLYNVDFNLQFGIFYLSYLFTKFDEDWQVFAAYNAGEGVVRSWLNAGLSSQEAIPYVETKNYVAKVKRAISYYRNKKFVAFD